MIGLGVGVGHIANGGIDAAIRSLFTGGVQGAFYDPSDFSTLFQDSTGTTPVTAVEQSVGKMLDKSGRGNHASQATAAARPVISARHNLLTLTDSAFSTGSWGKVGAGTGTAAAIASDAYNGEVGVGRLQVALNGGTTTNDRSALVRNVTGRGTAGEFYWSGVEVMATDPANVGKVVLFRGAGLSTYVQVTLTDTWQAVGRSEGAGAGSQSFELGLRGANGSADSADMLFRRPRVNAGSTEIRYQRVNTASDYDTAGFPRYLRFDGVDDYLRALFTIAQPFDRIGGYMFPTWNQFRTVIGGGNAVGGLLQQGSTTPDLRVNDGTGAPAISVPLGTNCVITERHNNTLSSIALNAGAAAVGTSGTTVPGGITIGSNDGASAFRDMNFYGCVMREGALTAAQIAVLQQHYRGITQAY